MRDSVLVAQLKNVKAKTAGLFGLTGAGSLNPMENERFAASLLAAVLILALIGAWAMRGGAAAKPAVITTQTSVDTQSVNQAAAPPQQSTITTNSSTSSSGSSNSNNSSVNVSVNGQRVSLPPNGSVHKVIQSGNTTTTIDASQSSTGNASNSYTDTTNLDVNNSSSSVTVDGGSQ